MIVVFYRDCSFFNLITDVVIEGTDYTFGNTFGTQSNPFIVYIDNFVVWKVSFL